MRIEYNHEEGDILKACGLDDVDNIDKKAFGALGKIMKAVRNCEKPNLSAEEYRLLLLFITYISINKGDQFAENLRSYIEALLIAGYGEAVSNSIGRGSEIVEALEMLDIKHIAPLAIFVNVTKDGGLGQKLDEIIKETTNGIV